MYSGISVYCFPFCSFVYMFSELYGFSFRCSRPVIFTCIQQAIFTLRPFLNIAIDRTPGEAELPLLHCFHAGMGRNIVHK
jgi:hypothetical protein